MGRYASRHATFPPEQETAQVGQVAEFVDVELLHEPHPRPLDQVTQQAVEGPEAEGHARLQRDRLPPPNVLVQELQPLAAHRLQLPQRHHADHLPNVTDERSPEIGGGLLQPEQANRRTHAEP